MRQFGDVLDGRFAEPLSEGGMSPVRGEVDHAPSASDHSLPTGPSARTRRFVLVVAVVVVLVLVGMAQVWVRLRIVRMGYDLSAETKKAEKLQRMEHKLEVEQAVLRRPSRLKEAASSRLGLREPGRGEVQVIDRGGADVAGGF